MEREGGSRAGGLEVNGCRGAGGGVVQSPLIKNRFSSLALSIPPPVWLPDG